MIGILSGETETRGLMRKQCLAQVNDVIVFTERLDLELFVLHGHRTRNKTP